MKKASMISLVSLLAGAAALVLRILQNDREFDGLSGLPIAGGVYGPALLALFGIAALVLCGLVFVIPRDTGDGPAFLDVFSTDEPAALTLPITGTLLLGLSGAADVATGLGVWGQSAQTISEAGLVPVLIGTGDSFSKTAHLVLGVLSLASAATLFMVTVACRRKEDRTLDSTLLLMTPLALVIRLVLAYRAHSVNPSLAVYYVELLALVLLTLAFYRLSSFGFRAGRSRLFCLYAALAVLFSLPALADAAHLATTLLYLGCSLTLTGFLLLYRKEIPAA